MAEESDQEKTEAATGKRIEKAREQGDVPRSREMATCVLLLVGGSGVWMFGDRLAMAINRTMVSMFAFERQQAFDPNLLFGVIGAHIEDILIALAPLAFLMLIATVASPLLLGGWLFNGESLIPKLSRLNPLSGIKNMFSLNSLVELGKGILKTVIVGGVAWSVIRSHIDAVLGLGVESLKTSTSHMTHLLWSAFLTMVAALIFIALIDVPYQLWRYANKLKMTRQEVKQEHKDADGDPHIKAKIRQAQRAMARRRMMAEIPTADVVITNPTHYAVALKYTDGVMKAPRIVAKGADAVAARIREIAGEHRVPMMEAPALARALHAHAEIGDEIPEALYAAVAEVLAYVFQLRTFSKFGGNRPTEPTVLAVPAELDPLNPAAQQPPAPRKADD